MTEILAKLNTPDESWRPGLHPNMLWYGPAAFGTYRGLERFSGFQRPVEKCFKGWAGGSAGSRRTKDFTFFGDGFISARAAGPRAPAFRSNPSLANRPPERSTSLGSAIGRGARAIC